MSRKPSIAFLSGTAALVALALGVAACGEDNSGTATAYSASSSTTTPASSTGSEQSKTVDATSVGDLGTVLVDSQGRTLYLFEKDTGTNSRCFGACASAWPPLRVSGKPTAGSGVEASMLDTAFRSDGKPQVTYNGHPLYTYAGDQGPGQATGQGSSAFGAEWYVVSPDGNAVDNS